MRTIKEIEKVIKAIDACTAKDEYRECLRSIAKMGETETTERLCATDGHVLAIIDMPKEEIEIAIKFAILFPVEGPDGAKAYVTAKKIGIAKDTLFPYPNVFCAIPELIPADSFFTKHVTTDVVERVMGLINAVERRRGEKATYFIPNFVSNYDRGMVVYANDVLFVGVMPLLPKHEDNRKSMEYYIPGLIRAPKEEEETLEVETLSE